MTKEELVAQLIGSVEAGLNEELVLLRARVHEVLKYLHGVDHPNRYTLVHIEKYLTGSYDSSIPKIETKSVVDPRYAVLCSCHKEYRNENDTVIASRTTDRFQGLARALGASTVNSREERRFCIGHVPEGWS